MRMRLNRPKRFVAQSTVGARTHVRLRSHSAEYCSRPVAHIGIRTRLASTTSLAALAATFCFQVDEFNATRLKLTAEMADTSNVVKTLVIKAEDARILNEMKLMKRMYAAGPSVCVARCVAHWVACSVLCCMLCFMLHAPPGTPICSTSTASSSVRQAHQSQSPPV